MPGDPRGLTRTHPFALPTPRRPVRGQQTACTPPGSVPINNPAPAPLYQNVGDFPKVVGSQVICKEIASLGGDTGLGFSRGSGQTLVAWVTLYWSGVAAILRDFSELRRHLSLNPVLLVKTRGQSVCR